MKVQLGLLLEHLLMLIQRDLICYKLKSVEMEQLFLGQFIWPFELLLKALMLLISKHFSSSLFHDDVHRVCGDDGDVYVQFIVQAQVNLL